MSSTTQYRIVSNTDAFEPREGTLADARRLAIDTNGDVDLWDTEADRKGLDAFAGRIYPTRGDSGFKLHEKVYGTFYTQGKLAALRYLWRDTLGRIEFQWPFQSPVYIHPKSR